MCPVFDLETSIMGGLGVKWEDKIVDRVIADIPRIRSTLNVVVHAI